MRNTVKIVHPDELDNVETFHTDLKMGDFIIDHFEQWSPHYKIYHGDIVKVNDVTPISEHDADTLNDLEGDFAIVIYPGVEYVVAALVLAVISLFAYIFRPEPEIPEITLPDAGSPNNSLGKRANRSRLKGRIPYILGQDRSTPDYIQLPHIKWEDNQAVEYAFMCIGVGEYDIDKVKEGSTLFEDIPGSSAEFYEPGETPNAGTPAPYLTIGTAIEEQVHTVIAMDGVNGQVLEPKDQKLYDTTTSVRMRYPNFIENNGGESFLDYFKVGQTVTLTNAIYAQVPFAAEDFAGAYEITAVTSTQITLDDPASVNGSWTTLNTWSPTETSYGSDATDGADIQTTGESRVGPFFVHKDVLFLLRFNFVAHRGLFKLNEDGDQTSTYVTLRIRVEHVDIDGNNNGSTTNYDVTMNGSAVDKDAKGITYELLFPSLADQYYKVDVHQYANEVDQDDHDGTIYRDITWDACYLIMTDTITDYGDVTCVQTRVVANRDSEGIKSRNFNCLAYRKIPTRISGTTFTSSLTATNNVDEILAFVCLDHHVGNRVVAELDLDSIYNTVDAIDTYFGNSIASDFNYTFDKTSLSFEQTVGIIMSAVFSIAYRVGNVIKMSFDSSSVDSVLLFNHRNKLPGTEKRSIAFGPNSDNDGVEVEYIDDSVNEYSLEVISLPLGVELVNPKKLRLIGVLGKLKAFYHAYRLYNKILYQNIVTEFTATQESDILLQNDRILVADNTRTATQDGEVLDHVSMVLTLSQKVVFTGGVNYTIFLQLVDGTVESIVITAGATDYEVTLATAPSETLVYGSETFARTTYMIVGDTNKRETAFLLTRNEPDQNLTSKITAINYDQRYYENDFLMIHFNPINTNYVDISPLEYVLSDIGSAAIITDGTRGYVHDGSAATDSINIGTFLTTASYTKMMWIKKDDEVTGVHLMSNAVESFEITAGGLLEAGHSTSNAVSFDFGTAEDMTTWHHVCLTYDASTLDMNLYLNGALVDTDLSVAQRTLGDTDLALCAKGTTGASTNAFIGQVDAIRVYNKALVAEEVLDMYNKTKI